jgi:hypothetical protein
VSYDGDEVTTYMDCAVCGKPTDQSMDRGEREIPLPCHNACVWPVGARPMLVRVGCFWYLARSLAQALRAYIDEFEELAFDELPTSLMEVPLVRAKMIRIRNAEGGGSKSLFTIYRNAYRRDPGVREATFLARTDF